MSGGRSNSAMDTVNAAASVIAASDNRMSPSTPVQKRRWGGFLNLSGCVASRKHNRRIIDAVVVPDPIAPRVETPAAIAAAETMFQPASIVLFPFVAPPSSPVSFLQSEPPSVTLSPANGLSLDAISESMYSPGRPSMFNIGPYAHETQLVSPPVPSTYTTEPSTAPFTPPPESVYLTRPSSPEVPFGWLLSPIHQNGGNAQASYQLPDDEIVPECHHFIDIITTDSSKLAGLKSTALFEWRSRQGSSAMEHGNRSDFVLDNRKSNVSPPHSHIHHLWRTDDEVGDHRFIF